MRSSFFPSSYDEPTVLRLRLRLRTEHPATGQVMIAAAGELDMSNSNQLHDTVTAAVHQHRPTHLTINLAEVSFLDSSGIRALLTCRRDATAAGTRLHITNVHPQVRQVLRIAGLLDTFDLA